MASRLGKLLSRPFSNKIDNDLSKRLLVELEKFESEEIQRRQLRAEWIKSLGDLLEKSRELKGITHEIYETSLEIRKKCQFYKHKTKR